VIRHCADRIGKDALCAPEQVVQVLCALLRQGPFLAPLRLHFIDERRQLDCERRQAQLQEVGGIGAWVRMHLGLFGCAIDETRGETEVPVNAPQTGS